MTTEQNAGFRAALEKRYEFQSWQGSNKLDTELFVSGFFFSGDELPDWKLARHRELRSLELPRTVRSLWEGGNEERAAESLLVEVYECDRRREAHAFLIDLAGEFQGPALERTEQVGDVGFASAGRHGILFARGNLVISVRNAGSRLREVDELAATLDRQLTERPEPGPGAAPRIRAFRPGPGFEPGRGGPLEVEVAHPRQRPVWLKLFSEGGEVYREEGRLMWTRAAPGPARVTLYALAEDGTISSEALDLGGGPS